MVDFFKKRKDGGPASNVTGYWLIEWKRGFSVALLRFDRGSREAYHSHAFNCVSWLLSGHLSEHRLNGGAGQVFEYKPSWRPFVTRREHMHKVTGGPKHSWLLTFRGPWVKRWDEVLPDGTRVILTDGRKVVSTWLN